jgi:hypothetical protein
MAINITKPEIIVRDKLNQIDANVSAEKMPAGSIVQTKFLRNSNTFDSTVNGYVTYQTMDFAPKFANSLLIIEWTGHYYKYNTYNGGNSPGRLLYNGSQIWLNSYMTYLNGVSAEYMHSAMMRVPYSPGSTEMATIQVQLSAGSQGRAYVYHNTGGLSVTEIKQ